MGWSRCDYLAHRQNWPQSFGRQSSWSFATPAMPEAASRAHRIGTQQNMGQRSRWAALVTSLSAARTARLNLRGGLRGPSALSARFATQSYLVLNARYSTRVSSRFIVAAQSLASGSAIQFHPAPVVRLRDRSGPRPILRKVAGPKPLGCIDIFY